MSLHACRQCTRFSIQAPQAVWYVVAVCGVVAGYTAKDYLGWDPVTEAPPDNALHSHKVAQACQPPASNPCPYTKARKHAASLRHRDESPCIVKGVSHGIVTLSSLGCHSHMTKMNHVAKGP